MYVRKLSNAAVLRDTTITSTMPTTQLGSCSSRRKNAISPSCGGLPGQAPVHAARSPAAPTRPKMKVTATVAIEVPMTKSLSVLEAKVRIQNPETKKSLVNTATGRIYMSCQPSKLDLSKPEDSTRFLSMWVSTPTVMTARMTKPTTMAPWIISVTKEIRNPPRAMWKIRETS